MEQKKSKRGFGAMDPAKQKEAASRGGKARSKNQSGKSQTGESM